MSHDFLGCRIKERVGIAIIAAEGYSTLANRIEAIKRHDRISVNLPIAYWSFGGDLTKEDDQSGVIDRLDMIAKRFLVDHGVRLGVVIIDVLAAAFGMTEENSNAEAANVIRILRKIGAATRALIIPVHHYGKTHEAGLRGASAFRGGADTIISVMARRDDPQGKVGDRSVSLAKSRTGKEGHICGFDLIHVALGVDEDGDEYGDAVVIPNAKPSSPGKPRKEAGSTIDLKAAFEAAINAASSIIPGVTGSRHCRAVLVTAVREEFTRLRRKSNADDKKGVDAARKAFDHALRRLGAEFTIAPDCEGIKWMWRTADGDLEMAEISKNFPSPPSNDAGENGRAP